MDTKAIEYFYISNDIISYPVYTQEGVPAFYDGTSLIRWAYSVNPHVLYKLNLTPIAGA